MSEVAAVRIFEFEGAKLPTLMHEGEPYVAMRPIVRAMGLNWKGQHEKLLAEKEKMTCVDIHTTGADGKRYRMLCIPTRKLNGWLFSINSAKIPDAGKRALIEVYQERCFEALHDFWTKGFAVRDDADPRYTSDEVFKIVDERIKAAIEAYKAQHPPITRNDIEALSAKIDGATDPRFNLSATMTALQILDYCKVSKRLRVRGLTARISHIVREWCATNAIYAARTPVEANPSRTWRFDARAVVHWIHKCNGAEIVNRVASEMAIAAKRVHVQTTLDLAGRPN